MKNGVKGFKIELLIPRDLTLLQRGCESLGISVLVEIA